MTESSGRLDRLNQPRVSYIYLVKTGGSDSYKVVLPKHLGGGVKYFATRKYGGAESAHSQAYAWLSKRLPAGKRYANIQRAQANRGATRSGSKAGSGSVKNGVYAVTVNGYEYFSASAYEPAGKKLSKLFSIAKHGWAMALRFAIRKRLAWEHLHYQHRSKLTSEQWAQLVELAQAQSVPGKPVTHISQIRHPGSITQPDALGYQARLMRRGQAQSAYFSFRAYGDAHEAYAGALIWCLATDSACSPNRRVVAATARNRSTGVAGVCRRIVHSRHGRPSVVYEASISRAPGPPSVRFSVGPPDEITAEQEQAALAVATRCRAAYEDWLDGRAPFNRKSWLNWKARFGFPEAV